MKNQKLNKIGIGKKAIKFSKNSEIISAFIFHSLPSADEPVTNTMPAVSLVIKG